MHHELQPLALLSGRRRPNIYWPTLLALLAPLALGCSKADPDGGEQTSSSISALTCSNAAVLGFESPSSWAATGGSIAASTRRIEGNASVRLSGSTSLSVKSVATCLPAGSYANVGFYAAAFTASTALFVPAFTVRLDSDAAGVHEVLATHSAPLNDGLFARFEMAIPPAVAQKLSPGVSDLRVTVQVAGGGAAVDVLLDGVSFRAAPVAAKPNSAQVEPRTITVRYPTAADPLSVALLASHGLTVSDFARVTTSGNGFGQVASVGGVQTEIGVEARTGSVTSVPSVALKDRSSVTGSVTTSGQILRGNSSVITGAASAGASIPVSELTWNVDFQRSSEAISLEPDARRTAAPGAYGSVVVKPRAKLTLNSGAYYLQSLDVQADADLILDTTGGPIVLYVRDTLMLRGRMSYAGRLGDLLLGYLGTQPVDLDTKFEGVLVAPNASVRLGVGGTPHSGAVFGKVVRLDPRAAFTARPALPLFVGSGSMESCARRISESEWARTNTQVALQEALLRYCGVSDAGPCETTLLARLNVDYYLGATRVLQETMTTSKHFAFMLDRERKTRLIHGNETLSCQILNGDADGDFVADGPDACDDTPELTATLANGCTDPASPPAPSIDAIKQGDFNLAIPSDPRCFTAPSPTIPSPFGAWRYPSDPSVGKAIWISKDVDTSGCKIYYQLEAKLTDGSIQTVVLTAADDTIVSWLQKPANTLQLNVRVGDGGGRGAWARYTVYTDRYRARAFNAGGRRSAWSDWYRPGQEGCAAGACSDF